jgi:hypothetical protein
MTVIVPPSTEYHFAVEASKRRVVDERAVMLGQDVLRPDPITMTLRRGVAAIGHLFRRDRETVPVATASNPVQQITSIVPLASDEDAPRIAA